MTIRIAGKTWRIHRSRRPENRGEDGNVVYHRRSIYIDPSLSGKALTETVVHEWLHVRWPDLSEESVTQAARELVRLLGRVSADA